jgi:MHS family proline/betaine transporter-like MFS transporter
LAEHVFGFVVRNSSATSPTNVRYGGTSIGFNIAVPAFGGTTPLIAAALVESTGDLLIPAYMLIGAGIIGAICVYFIRETAGKPLMGSAPIVESEEEAREMAARA